MCVWLRLWWICAEWPPAGKPGKVGEFDIGQGKVREIVVCLWCATAVYLFETWEPSTMPRL